MSSFIKDLYGFPLSIISLPTDHYIQELGIKVKRRGDRRNVPHPVHSASVDLLFIIQAAL